jgi:hypothetical protein
VIPQVLRAMALAYERLDRADVAVEYIQEALAALPADDPVRAAYQADRLRLEQAVATREHGRPGVSVWRRPVSWLVLGVVIIVLVLAVARCVV